MESVGLIETKGDIAAIVAADAMLKAANVNLLEKTYVGGGLVSVAVTGDVAAVRAAVESGMGAIHNLNKELLVSKHVIPRPQQDLSDIVLASKPLKDRKKAANEAASHHEESTEAKPVQDTKDKEAEKEQEEKKKDQEVKKDEKKEDKKETSKELDLEKYIEGIDLDGPESKEMVDKIVADHGLDQLEGLINQLRVVELRKLARKYDDFGIKGREISRADKGSLIEEFVRYYSSN